MKVLRSVCCLLLSAYCLLSFAQAPDTVWTKTYGGSQWDIGRSIQITDDGGFIIVGYTRSFGQGGSDIWLMKTNNCGDTIWSMTFGGPNDDVGNEVQQTIDGGYIVVGYTNSFGAGGQDIYILKTDSSGAVQWAKTFGGLQNDFGFSIQQMINGNYIITGKTASYGSGGTDVILICADPQGDTLWVRTYGDTANDAGLSVRGTFDGNWVVSEIYFSIQRALVR